MTMVATDSLRQELGARGFRKLGFWTRGVDTELFNPDNPATLDLPRPIFMTMGRVAVEKNLEAFLSLDLPGTKVVVGDGPQKAQLARKYPNAVFLGEKKGEDLTAHLAAADVFVFPSLTDTFGVVQLEALACGTPVAAFPVTGPMDVIADHPIGALDTDLRSACLARADDVARDLPEFCAGAFLGKQRAAVHRQSDGAAAQPFAAAGARVRPPPAPCRAEHQTSHTSETRRQNEPWQRSSSLTAAGRWISTARRSSRPTTAGRRFTTSCSAACSARAARRRSRPPTRSAAACSRSASAPASRCRNTRRTCASSAPTFRRRCCRRPRSASTELGLKNVEGLAVMDAEKLEFPDNSFDVVMAQYVVTAVPNPEAALDEFARVLRPGGELIILTRVSADAGMRRFIEQRLQPVVRPLGFRTAEFAWSRYAQWLAGARGMELAERRLVPPLGHFSLVRFRKIDVAAAA